MFLLSKTAARLSAKTYFNSFKAMGVLIHLKKGYLLSDTGIEFQPANVIM